MKEMATSWLPAVMVLATLLFCGPLTAATIHVATEGSDAAPGTAEQPLRTLEAARDAVRARLQEPDLAKEGITVLIHPGDWRMTETLQFGADDSGSADAPVIWRGADSREASISGGVRLSGFEPVTGPPREHLTDRARDNVVQIDLKKLGVTDFGNPTPKGKGPMAQLVFNSQFLPLARYPNEGDWLTISSIPEGGEKHETSRGTHWGRFAYDSQRPRQWTDTEDLWVHGYWVHDWRDEYHLVEKLDAEAGVVWPKPPYHHYGYLRGQRFYFLNVLEELDAPGEWYLDRDTGMLYLWPPAPLQEAEVFFPQLKDTMIRLDGTSHLHIQNLTLESTLGRAVEINGGTGNQIAGCTIRSIVGNPAVTITGSDNCIRSSDLYQVAGTGVTIRGGDRETLTPAGNYAENCDIHHAGRIHRTYNGAFKLHGVGNRISHCYVHDLPHQAIGYGGNDHIVEYCEFTRIAEETGDVGVLYTAMDWASMGHEVRYNYFHDIHGPGRLGCRIIYPDLPCGGIHLHGNIFYDINIGFFTNSGRGMRIENNLFLAHQQAIGFNVWTDRQKFLPDGDWRMVERIREVNYDQPPFSDRYPALRQLAEDFALGPDQWVERAFPKDNVVRNNVSDGKLFARLHPKATLEHVQIEGNLIADDTVFNGSLPGVEEPGIWENGDSTVARVFEQRGNVIIDGNPRWDILASGDFSLDRVPAAARIDFEPIPFDDIGLVADEHRRRVSLHANAPAIVPDQGRFLTQQRVRIRPAPSPRGPNCVIRYTLDGSEPDADSAAYSEPIVLENTATVRAAAFVSDGARQTRSHPVTAQFEKIALDADGIYLSDLPEQDLEAYMPCWSKDANYRGEPISLKGQQFDRGILLHPAETDTGGRAMVTYALDGELARASRFQATIGIDDSMHEHEKGSARFLVEVHRRGDWQRVFESDVMRLGDEPQTVDVDISGARRLRLIATDAGDGISCDHATWASARIMP